jgi:hypothetical protein
MRSPVLVVALLGLMALAGAAAVEQKQSASRDIPLRRRLAASTGTPSSDALVELYGRAKHALQERATSQKGGAVQFQVPPGAVQPVASITGRTAAQGDDNAAALPAQEPPPAAARATTSTATIVVPLSLPSNGTYTAADLEVRRWRRR